MREKVAESRVI